MPVLTLTQSPTPAQIATLNTLKPNTKWVAGRKIKLVEKFENRATHSFSDTVHTQGTITYMDPTVFDMKSTGSMPCGDFNRKDECDSDKPADVSDIQLVRLMQARASFRPQMVDVNLSPYDLGGIAAMKGEGEHSNPFDLFDAEPYFEWLAGFEDAY